MSIDRETDHGQAFNDDAEVAALSCIVGLLKATSTEARERMLNYICDRFPRIRIAEGDKRQ